jgi:uncharacterized protein HemY
MIKQFSDFMWSAIILLFQLVLAAVLIALIMGEAGGSVVTSVYANVRDLLTSLNPATVAVVAVLYLFWQLHKNRLA